VEEVPEFAAGIFGGKRFVSVRDIANASTFASTLGP
jgi:hypothetical protein